MIFFNELGVDAGFVIKTFEVCECDEMHEVVITSQIFSDEDEA